VTDAATLSPAPRPERRELALRLIMLEKLVKAALVLSAALAFGGMLVTGTSIHLHGIATDLREHVTAAWSVYLADAVVSVTERRHLTVATGALFLDGVTTGLEWYALARGRPWGEWLVVAAMSALLPFEVVALVREQHLGRLIVLIGNLLIVAYLVHHARKHAAMRAAAAR
jgi:uncharacterized membrane protein (DUF2068 family)